MNALALLALSVVGAGDVQLLEFSSVYCGPCQRVKPTVEQIAAEGFPVRMVDVDREPQVRAQYNVTAWPTFIMLRDGQVVARHEGILTYDQIRSLFAQAGYVPGQQEPPSAPPSAIEQAGATGPLTPSQRAMAASVRLKVVDPQGNSFGTGTIIDSHGDEALVVTCGHIFRDSQGKGAISVDLFLDGQVHTVPGQLISYDTQDDVGLVAIRPGVTVEAVSVAPPQAAIGPGQSVFSIGCDHGSNPSLQRSQITTVNRFGGPDNIEVAGRPVQGRSGGGLFNAEGQLIGICNADIAGDNEGLYAALSVVQAELDQNNLSFVYQREPQTVSDPGVQLAVREQPVPATSGGLPEMPGHMPPAVSGSEQFAGAAAMLQSNADTEVICIVRSRGQAREGECIVLQQPSAELLDQLNREYRSQQGQMPTNMRTQR